MIEKQRNYDLSASLLLSGKDITSKLTELEWKSHCETASLALSKHQNRVNLQTPQQLQLAVEQGRGIMLVDPKEKKLLGFAQVKEMAPGKLEFASLIGLVRGISGPMIMAGAVLGYDIDANAQVIAKVRGGNESAYRAFKEVGGKLVGYEVSEEYFNPDSLQPYSKSFFDVSLRSLYPVAPERTKLVYQPENYQLPLDI